MCLLVLGWQAHPRYRLVVAANRDEYHERPAAPLGKWPAPHDILAGRDLRAGGTWLGVDRRRRFGVVTNFRELQRPRPQARSRGELIPRYLTEPGPVEDFLARLQSEAQAYSAFNLLLADGADGLWFVSNRSEPFARRLQPGVYGLSNHTLDAPWPKLERVRGRFEAWLRDPSDPPASALFAMLDDRTRVDQDAALPHTGLSPEWERILSSPFVLHPEYGTRCSTVLLIEASGSLYLAERRFDPEGRPTGETEFRLNDNEWP